MLMGAACGSPAVRPSGPVAFRVVERGEPRSTELADTARAGESGRRVTVSGTLAVPDPCHTDLRVSGRSDGSRLRVRLEAWSTGGMCAAVLSAVDYRAATAERMPAGAWVVEVYHAGIDTARRVATDTVRVPKVENP